MLRRIVPLALSTVVIWTSAAQAQYPPGYYPGSGGYYPGRVGGTLYGAADSIRAQGDVMVQSEQARIQREQAEQAKIDTRRKAFDEAAYEKANTPTYAEKVAASEMALFQRVLIKPTAIEVSSGRAHNIVMPHIDRMARQGIFGPTTPIDPTMLAVINVKAPGGTGMAMLSDVSNIPWPIALYGTKKQEKLQTSLDQAVKTIMTKGRLDPKTYSECQTNAKALRDELDQLFDAEKINMSRFAEGSSFMQALQKEVAHLGDPGIAKSLGGGMRPRGNDVLELVHYMTTTGLQFAPCRPGDEAAYQSLFTAMSGFAQSAQVAAGVSTQPSVPPPTAPYKK